MHCNWTDFLANPASRVSACCFCAGIKALPDTILTQVVVCLYIYPESSIKVSVYPDLLNKSGEWVKVSWDLDSPSTEDWVGFFLLPNDSFVIDPRYHAPTKFQVSYKIYLLIESDDNHQWCQITFKFCSK